MRPSASAPRCRSRWASSSATNGTSTQLIEHQLIDYARVTLPNVGGISEFMKIVALAETHYVGMIPHFTGPIAEAALVNCLTATSSVALMEMLGRGAALGPICKAMISRTASCGRTSGLGWD